MAKYYLKNFSLPDTWNLDETFTLRDLIENSQGQLEALGDYLYSDGTFGAGYKSNAIGRVYYKTDTKCKVVALQDVDSSSVNWGLQTQVNQLYDTLDGSNYYGYLPYGGNYNGTPHLSFISISGSFGFSHDTGKQATANIAAKGSSYPAGYKCHNYGNSTWEVGKPGDWYLPTIGELCLIYKAFGLMGTLDTDYLSGTGMNSMKNNWYWSSTERSSSYAYRLYFGFGHINHDPYKNTNLYVRSVLEFNLQ